MEVGIKLVKKPDLGVGKFVLVSNRELGTT